MSSNQLQCHDVLIGVIFRCTIRSGHASVAIIVSSDHFVDPGVENSHGVVPRRCASSADRQDEKVVHVVIRFGGSAWNDSPEKSSACGDTMKLLRSNIRRMCKLGNEVEFHGSFEMQLSELQPKTATSCDIAIEEVSCVQNRLQKKSFTPNNFSEWDRFIVDYPKFSNVRVVEVQKWDSTRCQILRTKYFPQSTEKDRTKLVHTSSCRSKNTPNRITKNSSKHHKSGLGKRQQGEVVADFLLWVLSTIYSDNGDDGPCNDFDERYNVCSLGLGRQNIDSTLDKHVSHSFMDRWVPLDSSLAAPNKTCINERNALVASILCQRKVGTNGRAHNGSIIDVAGGAGHVSLALALRGIRSTVVDPRCTVGSLPGRDRKQLKKAKKEPFKTYRAWFGSRPTGVDVFFREGCQDYFAKSKVEKRRKTSRCRDDESSIGPNETYSIPICSMHSEDRLLPNSTAIVALHPDEATGIIVETAVEQRIPFVVMEGNVVSTYYDLIDWLVAKDPSIQVTQLPFDGANIAIWATFL
ncbi:hypothetical protein ACHAW6_004745 [Cyclotella cf. meneghiniana]